MKEEYTNTDVLIVGASPTGLMMACLLAIHRIRFRIIDKRDRGAIYSGALILHARSMEIFYQLGIALNTIHHGIIADKITVLINGKKFDLSMKDIGNGFNMFPNLFMIEQAKTEQVLSNFVESHAYSIERNTELLHITQVASGVIAKLMLPNGTEEIVRTGYLIGTDGGCSLVRQVSAIPYIGKTYKIPLFICDCKGAVNLSHNQIYFSFTRHAGVGFFPLTGERWRIDGVIPAEFENKDDLTFYDIEKKILFRNKNENKAI